MKGTNGQVNCKKKIPDASRRVLTIQLNELLQHQLIAKTIYPELPPKVEYQLTAFGETLMPVTKAVGEWGDKYELRLREVINREIRNN
ncbi:winged helix-turn-helix transcriptional regulator [Mucilaginibacter sp. CAU 1740]|uniref:winged helix-turn-helix transcriptional regulator n=1 Tax=Mucilaginibacter sp. CAU 1740 TaxID=3140365 RepID=UPI00325B262B